MMEYSNDGISSAGEPESGQHQVLRRVSENDCQ